MNEYIDYWGHGYSDGPDIEYSTSLFASQLSELCVILRITKPFDIVALSMGASTAITFTVCNPHMVRKLILQSPSIIDDPLEWRLQLALRIPVVCEIGCKILIPGFGEGANVKNQAVVRGAYRLLMNRLKNGGSWNAGTKETNGAIVYLKLLNEKLSNRLPILTLWGGKDIVVPISDADKVLAIVPHAEKVVHPDADHMSFADGDESVREFFRDHVLHFIQSGCVRNPTLPENSTSEGDIARPLLAIVSQN